MLSQLPGGTTICAMDEYLTTKWISPQGCELIGFANEAEFMEATHGNTVSLIHEQDLEKIHNELMKSIQEQRNFMNIGLEELMAS